MQIWHRVRYPQRAMKHHRHEAALANNLTLVYATKRWQSRCLDIGKDEQSRQIFAQTRYAWPHHGVSLVVEQPPGRQSSQSFHNTRR